MGQVERVIAGICNHIVGLMAVNSLPIVWYNSVNVDKRSLLLAVCSCSQPPCIAPTGCWQRWFPSGHGLVLESKLDSMLCRCVVMGCHEFPGMLKNENKLLYLHEKILSYRHESSWITIVNTRQLGVPDMQIRPLLFGDSIARSQSSATKHHFKPRFK